jgi:hypothetical protein
MVVGGLVLSTVVEGGMRSIWGEAGAVVVVVVVLGK